MSKCLEDGQMKKVIYFIFIVLLVDTRIFIFTFIKELAGFIRPAS